ncbi:MAG TPA: hypothetical protein DHW42_10300 [Candidatus Marinimicrobia bacterium]|nr:hypothetical protein [Candidatus Neomarinimicrobiota bacterium]
MNDKSNIHEVIIQLPIEARAFKLIWVNENMLKRSIIVGITVDSGVRESARNRINSAIDR